MDIDCRPQVQVARYLEDCLLGLTGDSWSRYMYPSSSWLIRCEGGGLGPGTHYLPTYYSNRGKHRCSAFGRINYVNAHI